MTSIVGGFKGKHKSARVIGASVCVITFSGGLITWLSGSWKATELFSPDYGRAGCLGGLFNCFPYASRKLWPANLLRTDWQKHAKRQATSTRCDSDISPISLCTDFFIHSLKKSVPHKTQKCLSRCDAGEHDLQGVSRQRRWPGRGRGWYSGVRQSTVSFYSENYSWFYWGGNLKSGITTYTHMK